MPKRKKSKPPSQEGGTMYHFRLDRKLRDVLKRAAREDKRSLKAHVELILEREARKQIEKEAREATENAGAQ